MELLTAVSILSLAVILTAIVSVKLTRRFLRAKNEVDHLFESLWRSIDQLKTAGDQKEEKLYQELSKKGEEIYRHIDHVYADLLKANESLVKSLKSQKSHD